MIKFLEYLKKIEGFKFIILAGVVLLILSVFANIIIGKEGISTTIHNVIIWPLFIIAVILIVSGLTIPLLQVKVPNTITEPIGSMDVVSTFDALRTTQKAIMKEIFRHHRDEISCNDLFDLFNKRHPNIIASHSELFYRILELKNKGLLDLRSVGEKYTIVKMPSTIASILETNNRISS